MRAEPDRDTERQSERRSHAGRAGRDGPVDRTNPGAEALQWFEPQQTAGKQFPYLFSQGEAILTRTWIPTQDSPGIRQTWTARIAAPKDLNVVMSAEMLGADPQWKVLLTGVLIIAAVAIDQWIRKVSV